ncbi:MAG: DUF2460 domain-containing protein, partial [Pseudomonadota bacterium]
SDTMIVAADSSAIQAGYEFDFDQGKLVFETPPSPGVKITAGFEFDVPVRFENEQLLITNTADGAGEVSEISLVEILI